MPQRKQYISTMKKLFSFARDVAVTVGCALGVGLLSGKESQIFVGGTVNIFIFAAVFFAANAAFRLYCAKRSVTSLQQLSACGLKRCSSAVNVALLACCFVSVTTMLAGVEQCVGYLVSVFPFPFYAFLTAALSTFVLTKGLSALKTANVISVIASAVLLAVILCKEKSAQSSAEVAPYMPAVYAMFSVTMSLGVICKLACECDAKQNLLRSAVSAATLGVIMYLVLQCCDFSAHLPALGELNGWEKAFAAVTLILAASTGIVAAATPVLESVSDVITDRTVASAVIFAFSLALSMFGFDFALKFGYAAVSAVGALLFVSVLVGKKRRAE